MDTTGAKEWELVGAHIRSAREKNGISMRELARRIDVSASHVSQVERGMASFSVRALYTVAGVLGVSMDSLFEPEDAAAEPQAVEGRAEQRDGSSLDDAGIVQRRSQRPTITLNSGPRWERLTAQAETACEFIEVIYAPRESDAPPPTDSARHEGREYGIVTQGSLHVQVGFDSTVLHEGDTIAFDSDIPHRFWNSTPDEVRAIWFVLDRYQMNVDQPHTSGSGTSTHRNAYESSRAATESISFV